MDRPTQILAAVMSKSVLARFEPLINRSDLSLTHVRSGQHALTLAQDLDYSLVIGQHPMTDIAFREFHSKLRATDCASRRATLLILTRDDRLDALSEELEDEDAQLFCIDLAPEQVEKALLEILGIAARAESRLLVKTSCDCEGEVYDRVFQTVNISESGLLLRSGSSLLIGAHLRFALSLPESEEPVRGLAEVIRHTRPELEGLEGTAIRFLRFELEDRTRLAQFIRQRVPTPI